MKSQQTTNEQKIIELYQVYQYEKNIKMINAFEQHKKLKSHTMK